MRQGCRHRRVEARNSNRQGPWREYKHYRAGPEVKPHILLHVVKNGLNRHGQRGRRRPMISDRKTMLRELAADTAAQWIPFGP